jgi:uncharacterized protein (DUF934 family)
MPLLKRGEIVADPWQAVGDSDQLPADAPVIVPFKRWQAERETFVGRNAPIGVRLANTQDVAALAPDLDRFGVIVLEFPAFKDGRAYSQARLLRERYNFKGELRAAGNVLRDQLMFMHRVGFDAYEITKGDPVAAWKAALAEFTVFYQPTRDGRTPVSDLRRRA